MAVAAKVPQIEAYPSPLEEYAHSLSTVRRLGYLAVNSLEASEEMQSVEQLALDDFTTAIAEMLKTDTQFRDFLDIDNVRTHHIIDGEVCAANGQSMVAILQNGVESSRKAALYNPELEAQVMRDECDVELAQRVNALEPGMTLWAISMEPKAELQQYKKTYTDLGYKQGLIYIQTYTNIDGHSAAVGSYSVDNSDQAEWRNLLATNGAHIPEDESSNTWLRWAVEQPANAEEAKSFAIGLRDTYYQRRGLEHKRHSVSDYVADNDAVIKQFFDIYYRPLAIATLTKQNSKTLQGLAISLLQKNIAQLKPQIRSQLIRIGNSQGFDDEAAKVVDSIIRYAVVEQLRKGLKPSADKNEGITIMPRTEVPSGFVMPRHQINTMIANNVQLGVEAGRSYGGCPGNIKLSNSLELEKGIPGNDDLRSPQEAFGGKYCPEIKDGQLTTCPHCNKKVRAIVPNRETIYCSNTDCKLVAPGLVRKPSEASKMGKGIMSVWQSTKKLHKSIVPVSE